MASTQAEQPAPDPFALAGALLEGKYRVDRVVAEGGFGVVYAGHHMVLDVPIAIKVLKPTLSDSAEQNQRFSCEAQTIAKLKHPAIVQVLDAGLSQPSTAPIAWMVLEWLKGQTLKANLAERRGLGGRSPVEAMAVMRPVLDAVCFAHSKHVVHRDLKPSNIMLSPGEGRTIVRVLDFGVAKAIDEESVPDTGHTQTGGSSHAFSRRYAAPEQISGGRTGTWTDLHALGLLLTELLTDRPPYESSDPTDLYGLVFHAQRPSPARRGVNVGPWQAIIERAVALKPARRFADVTSFAAALEQTLEKATLAFASRQAKAHEAKPETARLSMTGTTRSEATESNTFSVFSSESSDLNRSRFGSRSSRRAMSRAAAFLAVAAAGSYFVLAGHRSAGGVKDASPVGETATSVPVDLQPAPLVAPSTPADVPFTSEVPATSAAVDPSSAHAAPAQKPNQKAGVSRRTATPPIDTLPAPSARNQLPAYVVE